MVGGKEQCVRSRRKGRGREKGVGKEYAPAWVQAGGTGLVGVALAIRAGVGWMVGRRTWRVKLEKQPLSRKDRHRG